LAIIIRSYRSGNQVIIHVIIHVIIRSRYSCYRRIQEFFWPRLAKDLKDYILGCLVCA
jgi:hypothetical protein